MDEDRVEAQPFLKWAGGKWAIRERLTELLPRDARVRTYREPFLGGGAMFFHLQPERAVLTDALTDLIATYNVVCSSVAVLVQRLEALEKTHDETQYYAIRTRFNEEREAPAIERASWLVYLNKTCYNGLYRTNKKGEFNTPAGKFKTLTITEPNKLRLASAVLARAEIRSERFEKLLETAEPDDLIYMDPPYVPISKTSSFAGYSDGAFGREDQARLADVFRKLDERGCLLALSNSDTPLVRDLYAGFDFTPIIAPRAISSKSATRGDVSELLVRNAACVRLAAR